MNTKARIQKLEGAKPGQAAKDNREFTHRIGTGGVTYLIDGVEIDAATWTRERKAHDRSHAGEEVRTMVNIIGWDSIQEDANGVQ